MWFHIESDVDQPKWDVLRAFKDTRPKSRHVHGWFWVMEHFERGGDE